MQNKLSFFAAMIFLLLIGCAAESANSSETSTSQEVADTQQTDFNKNDPCTYISLDKFAEIFGLDVGQLSTTSEEFAGTSTCTFLSTEIVAEPGDAAEEIAMIAVRHNDNGKSHFDRAITNQLQNGTIKVLAGPDKDKNVPLKKIDQVGSDAMGHAAAHYATILFHDENQIRIAVTVYRKMPGNFIYNGLELSEDEALQKLKLMAKSLNWK